MKLKNTKNFIQNEIEALKSLKLKDFFSKIKNIGAKIGECQGETFTLSSHVEENLSPSEAAEKIAQHFSSISKEYLPLKFDSLPERVKVKITHPQVSRDCPLIEEYQVFKNFQKRSLKSCNVPGDIHPN